MFSTDFDNQSSVAARGVAYVLIGIGALISAMATAAFFHAYAADMFSFVSPQLSPWLAAAAGVFLFEFSAFAWAQIEARHSDTAEQITLAAAGKWLALIGSVSTTIVFFSLRSSLLIGRLDDTAVYVVSIIGGLLIIVGSSGMFLLIALYASASANHRLARNNASVRAMRAAAAHTINRESVAAEMQQTVEAIRQSLPDNARRQGQANSAQFVAERFTAAAEREKANPTPNGHR